MIEAGQAAPDFSLRNHKGETVTLAEFKGTKPVVLVFYPFTFTGVCQGELCQLRDDFSQFEAAGAEILALSCDTVPAQKMWAEQQGFPFSVLSDFWPHGAVSQAYGVFNDQLGCAMRSTFVINTDGVVVDVISSDALGTPREQAAYAEALAKL